MDTPPRRPPLRLVAGAVAVALAACATPAGTAPTTTPVEPELQMPPTTALQDQSPDAAAVASRDG